MMQPVTGYFSLIAAPNTEDNVHLKCFKQVVGYDDGSEFRSRLIKKCRKR